MPNDICTKCGRRSSYAPNVQQKRTTCIYCGGSLKTSGHVSGAPARQTSGEEMVPVPSASSVSQRSVPPRNVSNFSMPPQAKKKSRSSLSIVKIVIILVLAVLGIHTYSCSGVFKTKMTLDELTENLDRRIQNKEARSASRISEEQIEELIQEYADEAGVTLILGSVQVVDVPLYSDEGEKLKHSASGSWERPKAAHYIVGFKSRFKVDLGIFNRVFDYSRYARVDR